jgi:hypothetical protein
VGCLTAKFKYLICGAFFFVLFLQFEPAHAGALTTKSPSSFKKHACLANPWNH